MFELNHKPVLRIVSQKDIGGAKTFNELLELEKNGKVATAQKVIAQGYTSQGATLPPTSIKA